MTEEKGTNFVAVHKGSYYDSDFESEGELDQGQGQRNKSKKRKHGDGEDEDDELSVSWSSSSKQKKKKHKKEQRGPAKRSEVEKEYCKEQSRTQRFHIVSMDAYSRHKKFINDYMLYYRGSRSDYKRDMSKYKTDLDVIRENHKFLWKEEEDEEEDSWEKRLAKKYYDKLFKEYCITDLSRYKENKVAFRWQMEKEVISGKGQFICANKICEEKEGLRSWEVNFRYMEDGQKKNALVKVRLCPDCAYKLNYHHKRKEVTKNKKGSNSKRRNTNEDYVDNNSAKDKACSDEETIPQSQTEKEEDESVWTKKSQDSNEKSRQEEFEEYFEDMFL